MFQTDGYIFSQTSLRYVCLMAWQIRPSVVCDVRAPYSGGLTFRGYFCIIRCRQVIQVDMYCYGFASSWSRLWCPSSHLRGYKAVVHDALLVWTKDSMLWFCCLALDDYRPSSCYYCYCYHIYMFILNFVHCEITACDSDNKRSLILWIHRPIARFTTYTTGWAKLNGAKFHLHATTVYLLFNCYSKNQSLLWPTLYYHIEHERVLNRD